MSAAYQLLTYGRGQSYLYLTQQDRSAWTWELDCGLLLQSI